MELHMRTASMLLALAVAIATPAVAQTEAVKPLVDAEWLKANAGQENLVVLDIRDNIEGTDLGNAPYIEGAVVAPYGSAGWRTELDGVPDMLPSVDQIVRLIGDLGIENDDHVVIVPWGTDSTEFGSATRVRWTFKYLGHGAVSILDGGWRQYDAAGGARSVTAAQPQPVEFSHELQESLLATTEDVGAALQAGMTLVDGRPADQFMGRSKSPVVRVAGTIPGAVNIEHTDLYSAEYALFARPETIETLAMGVGLGAEEDNITFCNTGHWASIAWFGLSEVLGYKNTRMYDGSMAQWTADPSRPVE
jgi:thiosulfate/3-mercaptopyruvate sulfurtransferase